MNNYIPPFTITNDILALTSSIMEKVGRLNNYTNIDKKPILRKNNTINSIHSSLAIENNSLTLNQVKDVIDGKTVIGSQREIQEVKNAYDAYEELENINPYQVDELKRIHGIMTFLTIKDAGEFRNGDEGVFDGDNIIFMAPGPKLVPELIDNLFTWMNNYKDEINPLIMSSVFHYEFVFIHPFSDGNGRMARLWQNVILSKWREIFKYVTIENQIKKYQNEYYEAINTCNINGDSTIFIEFMLKMIDETLFETLESTKKETKNISEQVNKLLEIMDYDIPLSANEIMKRLNIKSKETLRNSYLNPAIKNGLIKMMLPDKPNSKNQKYYKL